VRKVASERRSRDESERIATHQVGLARLGRVQEEDDDLVCLSRLLELVFVGERLNRGAVE